MTSTVSFGDANAGFQAGIINGSANVVFNAPPERLETPPKPSIVIPFSRDTDFVERGAVLDQIHQKCTISGSRTALVGLGGVGKSQLAIEYSYRTRDFSPDTWIFWVHASNAARFEQSFREIANHVKIFGRQSPTANIFQLVHDWLCDDGKRKWILIIDNVDDAGFLVKAQSTDKDKQTHGRSSENLLPLMSYLPQCPNGSILITTRSEDEALDLVEHCDIIKIEPMSRVDALKLFHNKLGQHDDNSDHRDVSAELLAALEYMPLAIVQAAAYIQRRRLRYSVREYLQDFRESNRKRTSLLDYDGRQLRRDWEAKNSIIITWQISFDHIRKIRSSATDLLSLMSFFDRQGIPETLLQYRREQKESMEDQGETTFSSLLDYDTSHSDDDETDSSQSSVSNGFEEDVSVLRSYSFISVNSDGITFEMHGMVQLATQQWLKANKQQETWRQRYLRNLNTELPTGDYENWVMCQALFPHARSAVTQKPEDHNALDDWASILYKAAWYAWSMGKGVEAEEMSIQAMKIWEKMLGREHNDTLSGMTLVGLVYKLRGRWDAAEELEVQVMETCKKKFGVDHPDTLSSMNNLASTYWNQGGWKAAEELYVQVIETRKKKVGADHPDTLISMSNLALTYSNQGRLDTAEELQVQVMESYKKKQGVDHPDTLISMSNLATTFWSQGWWDAAEELEVQVMETRKKKLGVDHPSTLTSMNNLAFTWKETRRETEAIRLMEECVQSMKRVLGLDHPQTISSCKTLDTWKAELKDVVS